MEKPSWEKLVDKKIDSQKNLIYVLFTLLIVSFAFIYFQSVEFNKEISNLNSKVQSLEQVEKNVEIKITASEKKLENLITTVSRNLSNQIYSANSDISYLVSKIQRCEASISEINTYIGSLSSKITLNKQWYGNSYYLNVRNFSGGGLFSNSNDC